VQVPRSLCFARIESQLVMAGHSRPKDGVASLAYVPAIHVLLATQKDVDARHKAGHDDREIGASQLILGMRPSGLGGTSGAREWPSW